jgi:hypothetical protein
MFDATYLYSTNRFFKSTVHKPEEKLQSGERTAAAPAVHTDGPRIQLNQDKQWKRKQLMKFVNADGSWCVSCIVK